MSNACPVKEPKNIMPIPNMINPQQLRQPRTSFATSVKNETTTDAQIAHSRECRMYKLMRINQSDTAFSERVSSPESVRLAESFIIIKTMRQTLSLNICLMNARRSLRLTMTLHTPSSGWRYLMFFLRAGEACFSQATST